MSPVHERFVLKGGVLLAALDARRPTRDVDLAGLDISNDTESVLQLVRKVLEVNVPVEDGIVFAHQSASAQTIRDHDQYSGVRVKVTAMLASAKVNFHVDVNVGDPIWPAPEYVQIPRLLGGPPIGMAGYPLAMVYAEKIVTAIQRGTANTRWRDFGDIWTLTRRYSILSDELYGAIDSVSQHRRAQLTPLREALAGYPELGQDKWAAWRLRVSLLELPEIFESVLESVVAFSDPVIEDQVAHAVWDPNRSEWVHQVM